MKDVFEQFGKIKNLSLIRESDGSSKGCAFLTYELKESSILAIRKLNAAAYILDHDKPLEVRFAEDRKMPTKGGSVPPTGQYSHPYQPYGSTPYGKPYMPPNPYGVRIPLGLESYSLWIDATDYTAAADLY